MSPESIGFLVLGLTLGAAIGLLIGWLNGRQKASELTNALRTERELNAQQQRNLRDTFAAVAADALQKNNQGFLDLAKQTFERYQDGATNQLELRQKAIEGLVKPVWESLERFDSKVQELEKARIGAYKGITTQVDDLLKSQKDLRTETASLAHALKTPGVRGRWGEIQLRRTVELAGMVAHCDFVEQQSVTTDGGRLRPDLIVKLPGNSTIVVDAKSPIDQYLAAIDSDDEVKKREHLLKYAAQIRGHVSALSNKNYWDQFKPTPDFVFMFLPGESFYSAALQADPALIEIGATQRVILATPTTLIALLRAVSHGWRQDRLADDVEKIGSLGKELYERICTLGTHFVGLGSSLRSAVEKYNDTVGTLETRVLVSARRFKDMAITATDKEVKAASQIETIPRQLETQELGEFKETQIALAPENASSRMGVGK